MEQAPLQIRDAIPEIGLRIGYRGVVHTRSNFREDEVEEQSRLQMRRRDTHKSQ